LLQCKNHCFPQALIGIYQPQLNGWSRVRAGLAIFLEDKDMTDRHNQNRQNFVGPVGAVATVPGEFISVAIFEAVQGACRIGGKIAGRMRRA
jgi:hypothetical protein